MTNTAAPRLGACVRCQTVYRAVDPATADLGGSVPGMCGCAAPEHPASAVMWRQVKVTVNATKCGPRCHDAKSDKCACECGGENHGRKFAFAL